MSSISSKTLFHFTPNANNLISILKNEFHPKYCIEELPIDGANIKALPMVCFCDIPLSQIKDHIDTYGMYGIGMKKDWGTRNGLNPIFYVSEDSLLDKNLSSIISVFQKDELKNIAHLNEAKESYLHIIRYLKKYEGDFRRGDNIIEDVRFYNEREWRFCPPYNENIKFWLLEDEFKNPVSLAQANETLKNEKLSFEPNDIQYVIIKNESEIYPMIEALKDIKSKYDPRTIETLISKIITSDQILNDF